MENATSKTLGRYQLKDVLGEGGMGIVYRAYDPKLQRDVAIKVMHPHLLRKPGFKERFEQEAVVAANLKHPGIVQVFDSGDAGNSLYIVMAFIAGGNLEEMLNELKAKGEWVLLSEAVELVQQVAQALHYVHRHGVLHRDIKPGNIMLDPEPCGGLPFRPILTDLGLAKLLEGGVDTQTGVSMGTPAYMSPEQAQGLPVDVRSDVYSLGALLYHLCVGKPPFPAKTITEAMRYHAQQPPLPPRQANPRIPPGLDAVILKSLEKDPVRRYPDAAQFAEALGSALTTLPTRQAVVPTAGTPVIGDDRDIAATAVDTANSVSGANSVSSANQVSASTAVDTVGRSLATLLDQSIIRQRGPSVLDEFPRAAPQVGQDQIQVTEPGKEARVVPVKGQVITVGRTADNTIVLDDPKVSRAHLRIEQQGSVFMVTDQGSSNGSFLGGVKLLKGVAQEWDPAQPLKAGGTYLKLVRAREAVGTQVDTGTVPAQRKGEAKLSVITDTALLTVNPGGSAPLVIRIFNQGSQVDHYQVSTEGVPADWVKNLPDQPIRCMPGQEQALTIFVQPPRSAQSRAGQYTLSLMVTRQEDREQVVRSAALMVAPFQQFTALLHPERVRAGKPAWLQLTNQGNAAETFHIEWGDPANDLVFKPPETEISVEEGNTVEVEYRGRLRQGRLVGGEQFHRFSSIVSALQAGPLSQPQELSGDVISQGTFPAWLFPLLMLLCLLLAAGAGAFYGLVYLPSVQATQAAATAYAYGEKTAAVSTEENSDLDNDGLSNIREAKYDTNPANPDTDGDGLKDGEEIDVYHTDPKNRDTDGDTLLDGLEVQQGTNPLNRDTDGDGLQDNVDPDPGRLPTFTPTPTSTTTPTPTPRLTSTPTKPPTFTPTIPGAWQACPKLYPSHLHPGYRAYVSKDPPMRNNVRAEPKISGQLLGQIGPGDELKVLDGPVCADNYIWWHVSAYGWLDGWTAEGDYTTYWLIPVQ
jgi:eukaryotic-like serine/threonine-protein kinase